jgi:plastocyanin
MRLDPRHRNARTVRAAIAAAVALAFTGSLLAAPAAGADVSGPAGHVAKVKKLKGTVGPGFTITLNKASVPAGKYKIIVKDLGTIHNYHLFGTGVDEKTGIPETGTTTWKVTLTPGTYTAQCDAHPTQMSIALTVT